MYSALAGAAGRKPERVVIIRLCTYQLPRDTLPPLTETLSGHIVKHQWPPVNTLAGMQGKPAEQQEEPHQWKLLQEFLIIPVPDW